MEPVQLALKNVNQYIKRFRRKIIYLYALAQQMTLQLGSVILNQYYAMLEGTIR